MDPESTQTSSATTSAAPKIISALAIPGSIVVGFAMIAAAIFFSGSIAKPTTTDALPTNQAAATEAIRAVDEKDHVRGNPNAPIVFVEYSDFDCPFCKKFHEETMNKLMAEYGNTGKIAWVYRHFPLEQLHPNAPQIALASECVAELAGNDGFWKFSDLIFGEREINSQTDMTKISGYAVAAGTDAQAFATCMTEKRHTAAIEEDFADGANAGVQGTPHTFVLFGGQQGVINGAQSYATVKQLTDNLLKQLENGAPQE